MNRTSRSAAALAGFASMALVIGLVAPWATGAAAAATLSAPSVTAPVDATPELKDVTLLWTPVSGADSYDVQVGTDTSWSQDTPTFAGTSVTSALTLPVQLPHASYVWRVRTVRAGVHSVWSANGTFTRAWVDRPSGLVPAAGSTLTDVPTFSWNPIPNAAAYEVQLSTCPTFNDATPTTSSHCPPPASATPTSTDNNPTQVQNSPPVSTCFTTHPTVTLGIDRVPSTNPGPGNCVFTLANDGSPIFWRVRGGDMFVSSLAGNGDTTPGSQAGISHLPPGGDVATDCPGSTASPTAAPSATASATASASPGAAATGCAASVPMEFGAWSATQDFSLAIPTFGEADYTTLPLVVTHPLSATQCPTDARGPVCGDFPMISWDRVAGASSYRVYIALDDGYSNIIRVAETQAAQWLPTDAVRDSSVSQSYFYVVQPCTKSGCGPVTQNPPSFRKASPQLTLVSPASGANVGAADVQFQWQGLQDKLAAVTGSGSTEAAAYRLQVTDADTNPGFDPSGLILDQQVDGARCANVAGPVLTSAATQQAIAACQGTGVYQQAAQSNPFTGPDVVSYVPDKLRLPDGNLSWRVQAIDGSGNKLPWSAPASFLRDTTPPTATMSPLKGVSALPVFHVTFSEPVTGVDAGSLTLSPAVPATVQVTSPTSALLVPSQPLAIGGSYQLRMSSAIKDRAGLVAVVPGPTATVVSILDDSSPAISYSGAWGSRLSSSAYLGGYHRSVPTGRAQTAATASFFGTAIVIGGCAGPGNGFGDVWVDGVRRLHVDTYRSYSGCGLVVGLVTGLPSGFHRVQFRGVGVRNRASRGTAVGFDGFRAVA